MMEHFQNLLSMVMVCNYSVMEIIIRANTRWGVFMEKEGMYGIMVHNMMVILQKDVAMVQVDGNQIKLTMINTLVNTKMIKNQAKGNIHGIMAQFMKDISLMI